MKALEELLPVSQELLFKGRPGDPRLGEKVAVAPFSTFPDSKPKFALLGFPDDLGVRLNRGRAGAAGGPDSIRSHFYRLAVPSWWENCALYDFGNIPITSNILENHAQARAVASALFAQGFCVLALGGGHDYAAPLFEALAQHFPKAALLNLDPHLDMRELENGLPHSGTPFRQLLENGTLNGRNLAVFGAHPGRNSVSHWEYAMRHQVALWDRPWMSPQVDRLFEKAFAALVRRAGAMGITLDSDCCTDAEGSSAAPLVGFRATELARWIHFAGKSGKVHYLEVAEVAPTLDPTQRSSRAAAEILFAFLEGSINRKRVQKSRKTVKKRSN